MDRCYFFGLLAACPQAAEAGMNECGWCTSHRSACSIFFLPYSHLGFSFYLTLSVRARFFLSVASSLCLLFYLRTQPHTFPLYLLRFSLLRDSKCVGAVLKLAVSVVRECVVSESAGSACTVIKCTVSAPWAPKRCGGPKVLLWALGFCSLDWLLMSMSTHKSFSLLSCGCNCLFGAILSGLRCSLSSLLGTTVYAVYKLGLCTCCLWVALGCLSKASTASICFFRANVLVQLLKLTSLICCAEHTICTWSIYYRGKVGHGWDNME